ncbi:hypothetical protein D3C80_1997190 [compost metagenome]
MLVLLNISIHIESLIDNIYISNIEESEGSECTAAKSIRRGYAQRDLAGGSRDTGADPAHPQLSSAEA